MSDSSHSSGAGPAHRSVEIGVGLVILAFALIVIYGAWLAGINWGAEGPRAGFFPFYVGLSILIATIVNLVRAFGPGRKAAVRRMGPAAAGRCPS